MKERTVLQSSRNCLVEVERWDAVTDLACSRFRTLALWGSSPLEVL